MRNTGSLGQCLHRSKRKTLFPLLEHVRHALSGNNEGFSPFDEKGSLKKGHSIIATGYGRNHIDFVQDKLTEIKAHFLHIQDCLRLSEDYMILDIGGQDAKAITIKNGKVERFDINRKCAAGTGAYIEELAHRLELRLEDLTDLFQKTFPQKRFFLAPYAQYCGALGAALYGLKGRAEI